jgi:hypothetical protein
MVIRARPAKAEWRWDTAAYLFAFAVRNALIILQAGFIVVGDFGDVILVGNSQGACRLRQGGRIH